MFMFRRTCFILGFLPALLITQANANGINPPRPNGAQTVEARCTDRKTGSVATILRVRIMVDKPVGWLDVRLDKSDTQSVQLSKISRIQIAKIKPSKDGFVKAALELMEPNYKGPGFVRLKVDGKPVRLTGFSTDLEHIDRPLESCKDLILKESKPAKADDQEPSKKEIIKF